MTIRFSNQLNQQYDMWLIDRVSIGLPDTTPPAITCWAGTTAVEATSAAGAKVIYSPPSATDNFDGPVAVTCKPPSGSVFAFGTNIVTCTSADDAAGNVGSSCTFDVEVVDTTPPAMTSCPADITAVEATSAAGATVTYAVPTATDIVDVSVAVTCKPPSGSVFAFGTNIVTCTSADDAAGNVGSSCTFDVEVVDTTPPAMTSCPADITAVEATSAAGATVTYAVPTATDIVDVSVAVTCKPPSGSVFGLGTSTVSCRAEDAAGNVGTSCTFGLEVVDTTPPAMTSCPADITAGVEAMSAAGATVTYAVPTATDNVDVSVAVTCTPPSGSVFGLGASTVSCDANDATGNRGKSCTFTVNVVEPFMQHEGYLLYAIKGSYANDLQGVVSACGRIPRGKPAGNYPGSGDCSGRVIPFTTTTCGQSDLFKCASDFPLPFVVVGNYPQGHCTGYLGNRLIVTGGWLSSAANHHLICAAPPQAVDCVVGAWDAWSACSASCGDGTRTRSRTTIKPRNGGADCPTDNTASEICFQGPCVSKYAGPNTKLASFLTKASASVADLTTEDRQALVNSIQDTEVQLYSESSQAFVDTQNSPTAEIPAPSGGRNVKMQDWGSSVSKAIVSVHASSNADGFANLGLVPAQADPGEALFLRVHRFDANGGHVAATRMQSEACGIQSSAINVYLYSSGQSTGTNILEKGGQVEGPGGHGCFSITVPHTSVVAVLPTVSSPGSSSSPPIDSPSPSPSDDGDCSLDNGHLVNFYCPNLSKLMEHCYACFEPPDMEVVFCDGLTQEDIQAQCNPPL